ncbi:thiosulfate sulfurtransferase [Bordetella ansorpii]|uniref:Thiosulfate sulfurtransferase n=1 Tax=Bordetella ansorpii TaxID=288768 RepID=A0A157QBL4_9BORD|nr:sulfurtransferase [Bordetella ansorpii]SAI43283.1 thiosulfate sulfurtransferase [Bordetella ansorpii]
MTTPLISATDLAARVDAGDLDAGALRIFDVRHDLMDATAGRRAFEPGHVPGARFLDHETELCAPKTGANGRHPLPERDRFAGLMAAHGVRPETLVAAYDASGGTFAAHLWWMLRWIGHDRVVVLDGGWQAWNAAGLPVQAGPAAPLAPLADAKAGKPLAGTVDVQAVLANIDKPAFSLIDARAANRYRGETEPIDPVAGHIPGALNRPNSENLEADGRFKAPAQLRAEFDTLLAGRAPESIVHQCGSGISACHNLLAMEMAGLGGSRLYPGSWSEWVADPSRPVAKG